MTKKIFGTDGIRGKVNEYPITPELILKLGQAIGLYFKKNNIAPKILIGKDTRKSGYMLEQILSAGICSVGGNTYFLGPLPTPGIAYLTRGLRATAGIVISASHNPFEDNGFKIFTSSGYKLSDHGELDIEKIIFSDGLNKNLQIGGEIGRSRRVDDAIGQYSVFLKEQFPKHLSLDGIRIVLDCAHGASYKVAPKVFKELGAEVFLIGVEPNGKNINGNCGALHPQSLQEKVMLFKADIGIALDGDADRIIVVDDEGEIIDGDQLIAMCAIRMKQKDKLNNDTVVATVMSNMGLEIALKPHGIKVNRTDVGDRKVMESMIKNDFNLGGEQSGHLIFSDNSTTGDGILAGLCILETMLDEKKKISELKSCMTKLPQVLNNVKVKEKIPLDKLPKLQTKIKKTEKTLGNKGRVLIRYSGTERLARIMLEGENQTEIDQFATDLSKVMLEEMEQLIK